MKTINKLISWGYYPLMLCSMVTQAILGNPHCVLVLAILALFTGGICEISAKVNRKWTAAHQDLLEEYRNANRTSQALIEKQQATIDELLNEMRNYK